MTEKFYPREQWQADLIARLDQAKQDATRPPDEPVSGAWADDILKRMTRRHQTQQVATQIKYQAIADAMAFQLQNKKED